MKKKWIVEYELFGKAYRTKVPAETEFEALCKVREFAAKSLKIKSAKEDNPIADFIKGFEDIFKSTK